VYSVWPGRALWAAHVPHTGATFCPDADDARTRSVPPFRSFRVRPVVGCRSKVGAWDRFAQGLGLVLRALAVPALEGYGARTNADLASVLLGVAGESALTSFRHWSLLGRYR
jgi:hypothetical protein